MTRLVVLVSGNGSNLQAIIDRCHKKNTIEIVAVIANKAGAYGLTRAHKANIDAIMLENTQETSREEYDARLISTIDEYKPDLIILAGFMRILSPQFVQYFQGKIINIHPSVLPKYPGLHTHQRAIDAGDKEHGASVHFVTEELDGGPVILQVKVPVLEDDTIDSLSARVLQQEHLIYPLVVEWFCHQRLYMKNGKAYFDGVELEKTGANITIANITTANKKTR